MKEIYQSVTDLLQRACGIDVSTYDATFLGKSIHKRITETQCLSTEAYCKFLEQNDGEAKRLLDSLRIGYSEFFRNPLTFAVLERIVLPGMVMQKKNNGRKELRVWSAACAAGQEAYSLAMLLEEFEHGSSGKISYRIFATDDDESRVMEAQKGIFTEAALNNLHLKRLRQWFAKQGETYAVKPGLKKNIDFSLFDLSDGQLNCPPASIFGDFDLVVCANILFYYKPECRKTILEKAGNSLAKGGFLVTGETEREILMKHNYSEVFPQSAVFQKKLERG